MKENRESQERILGEGKRMCWEQSMHFFSSKAIMEKLKFKKINMKIAAWEGRFTLGKSFD